MKATGRRTASGWSSRASANPATRSTRSTPLDLTTGDTVRISPGIGKTTCSFFRPGTDQILFASTHHDPKSKQFQDDELAFRASGKERRYAWDYDPEMEIYAYAEKTKALTRLTNARGYDAEASYSPDGQWIAFSSMRDAYNRTLTDAEKKQLEVDPSFFGEIYIMKADGSGQKRLTNVNGYDGGPFFSPDGKRIVWRRFDESGLIADVWTMNPDGTDAKQVTKFGAMSWAPYIHPSGRVPAVRVEQARVRELRGVHGRRRRDERTGANHILGRLRRTAGAVTRRQAAGVDLEPRRRTRGPDFSGSVEP